MPLFVIKEDGFKYLSFPRGFKILEYLYEDMATFRSPIFKSYLEKVLTSNSYYEEITGNICSLEIRKNITNITTDFIPEGEVKEIQVETSELLALINLWSEVNKEKLDLEQS